MLHRAIAATVAEMRATVATSQLQAVVAMEMSEADAIAAMARMQGTVAMPVTQATRRQAATSRRVAQMPNAAVGVAVAGRPQGLHHVPRAARRLRLRCRTSNSAGLALQSFPTHGQSRAKGHL